MPELCQHSAEPSANGNGKHAGRLPPLRPVSDGTPGTATPSVPAPAAAQAPEAGGRQADGRFAPGNRCGRGNPFSRRLGSMRTAFLDAVNAADVQAVARKLLELAKGGDLAAAQLYLAYAVGKPLPVVNPDTLDAEEFEMLRRGPTLAQTAAILIDVVPADLAAGFASIFQVRDVAELRRKLLSQREEAPGHLAGQLRDELAARARRP
jgi:hypothetical protein